VDGEDFDEAGEEVGGAGDGEVAALRLVGSVTTTTGVIIATYRLAEPAAQ
jgi:hypothetical protein